MAIKIVGSALKSRVGRVSGNIGIFRPNSAATSCLLQAVKLIYGNMGWLRCVIVALLGLFIKHFHNRMYHVKNCINTIILVM